MPRPQNKSDLLALSQANFEKLNAIVDSYPPEEQRAEFPPGTMNRNIRDVLAHLHHWHGMMIDWYKVGMAGEKPDIPAKGYTRKITPELNRKIWEQYRNADLDKIRKDLSASHQKINALIERHRNEELFEKKRYPCTGSTSLGAT